MTTRTPIAPSLADQATRLLEELVVVSELAPGSSVTEQELCDRIGLGRTPVREAVQRLAAQRLLKVLPRRGILVTHVEATEYLGLLETRRALNRLMAGLAAVRASQDQRSELRDCALAMADAAGRDELKDYLRQDQRCYEIVQEASGNPSLVQAMEPLHAHCRRFWCLYRHAWDLEEAARGQLALMKAIIRGDEEGAAAASEAQMDYLDRFARAALDLE
ncbi:MAG TPA: GntR family transcriptional regulator [Holophagaceae bacterium]|nr:GntR family transcriptional regulator [Holophagaceae bacterium]